MCLISSFCGTHESDVGYDQDGTLESGVSDVEFNRRVIRRVRILMSQSLKEQGVSLTAYSVLSASQEALNSSSCV